MLPKLAVRGSKGKATVSKNAAKLNGRAKYTRIAIGGDKVTAQRRVTNVSRPAPGNKGQGCGKPGKQSSSCGSHEQRPKRGAARCTRASKTAQQKGVTKVADVAEATGTSLPATTETSSTAAPNPATEAKCDNSTNVNSASTQKPATATKAKAKCLASDKKLGEGEPQPQPPKKKKEKVFGGKKGKFGRQTGPEAERAHRERKAMLLLVEQIDAQRAIVDQLLPRDDVTGAAEADSSTVDRAVEALKALPTEAAARLSRCGAQLLKLSAELDEVSIGEVEHNEGKDAKVVRSAITDWPTKQANETRRIRKKAAARIEQYLARLGVL